MSYPFVSVIIPVLNDSERLKICLATLEAQNYPKHLYEVIVVDNGPDECIKSIVNQFRQARYENESRRSSYAARNKGISISNGEIIAFTDADCIPARDWIRKGVENLLREPACGLLAGKIEIFFENPQSPTAVELYEQTTYLLQESYIKHGSFGATANLFTFKRVFEHVNFFDGHAQSCGDVEWGRRVASFGYKLIYAEEVCVLHPARKTITELYQKIVRITGGTHYLRKNRRLILENERGFIFSLLPPINYSAVALRDRRLKTLADKVRVVVVMFFVRYVEAATRMRLSFNEIGKRERTSSLAADTPIVNKRSVF